MFNHSEHAQTFRMKSVACTTGLSAHVIRKWEERYHLLHPHREPNGYRLFTEDDVQLLLYLKSQLDNGESIGQLAQAGEDDLRVSMNQAPLDLSDIPPLYWNEVEETIRSARLQDMPVITVMIEAWICRLGLEKALAIIIFPLLRMIGELWHQGKLSLRGEQSVSRLVRQCLINVLREVPAPAEPSALIACVPGDFHEIGPLTAAVFLQGIGWHSTYFGPNASFEMVKLALRRKRAQLIILGCSIEPDEETLRSWLKDITQHLQPSCQIIVGGSGFASYAHVLNTYNIPYFNHVQNVKTYYPRPHILNSAGAGSQSSYAFW